MPTLERIWTDEELIYLRETIDTLRRIRSATTIGMEPFASGIQGTWGRWRHPERFQIPEDRQAVLGDAEELGISAGGFMAEVLCRNRRDISKFKSWENVLIRTMQTYLGHERVTFAATGNLEVGRSLIGHMRALQADPLHMLKFDLLTHNYLGADSLNELIRRNVTVVAPLSGDFLLAAIYRAHLEQTRGRSFHLRGAALSKKLTGVVLPSEDPVMEKNPEMAIFLDVTQTGETARTLLEALARNYPTKTIHSPNVEDMRERYLGFKPSGKMISKLGPNYFD